MNSKDYADKIAEEVIATQVPLGESITLSDLLAAAARKGYAMGWAAGSCK